MLFDFKGSRDESVDTGRRLNTAIFHRLSVR